MLSKYRGYLALLLLQLVAVWFVDISGEFPLNDSWAYSKALAENFETGRLIINEWQAIPMLPSMVLGGVLLELNGSFSFEILRALNLLLVTGCMLFCFRLLKNRVPTMAAFGICLVTFFNPLTWQSSVTFMPDALQMGLALVSILSFFNSDKKKDFFVAIVFLLMANLVRSSTLIVGVMYLVMLLFRKRYVHVLILLLSIIPVLSVQMMAEAFGTSIPSNAYQLKVMINNMCSFDLEIYGRALYYFFNAVSILGLVLLPRFTARCERSRFISIGIGLFLVGLKMLLLEKWLPFNGNVVWSGGVGPNIMTDAVSYESPVGWFGRFLWWLLAGIGLSNFMDLIVALWKDRGAGRSQVINQALFIVVMGYLIVLSFSYLSDRYLIFVAPLMVIIGFRFWGNSGRSMLIGGVIGFVFTALTVSDYFNIHRARWEALETLMSQDIPVNYIDGGFEFNAWYLFDFEAYTSNKTDRWWWIDKDEYIVTTAQLPYLRHQVIPVECWIAPVEEVVIYRNSNYLE